MLKLPKKHKFKLEFKAMKSIVFMAFFIPFLSPSAFSQEESKPELFVMCKHGSEVRTITVEKTPTGFKTVYSKGGVPKIVGTGMALQSNKGFA